MVMGLGITGFAEEKGSATITVTNAGNATLQYVKVIEANQKTETGWAFVGDAASAYMSAFSVDDPQKAIWMLIGYEDEKDGEKDIELPDGIEAATAAEINKALNAVTGFAPFTNGSSVSNAGVYVIDAKEENYTYNRMAAYVGFGEIKNDDGNIINEYPSLLDVEIDAKKSPMTITKTVDDNDGYYAIGQILTYKLEQYVPYVEPGKQDYKFEVVDELFNARYYLTGEKSVATIEMENEDGTSQPIGNYTNFTLKEPGEDEFFTQGFTIDLSDYVNESNSYAGRKITIKYTVKVTGDCSGENIWNNAVMHIDDQTIDANPVELHTGNIILTKYNKEETEKLADAGFEVRKKLDNGKYSEPLKFIEVRDGVYYYDPENGTETEIFTASEGYGVGTLAIEKGELLITGIDAGEYQFTETTAPKGYSLNQTPVSATLDQESSSNFRETVLTYVEYISINDTKLSALPSTGGMGTTIFTIAGCVIMISAAGLFFASRRKAN